MALDMARAVQTPFPPPDISSPKRSLANLSFIISNSASDKFLAKNKFGSFYYPKHKPECNVKAAWNRNMHILCPKCNLVETEERDRAFLQVTYELGEKNSTNRTTAKSSTALCTKGQILCVSGIFTSVLADKTRYRRRSSGALVEQESDGRSVAKNREIEWQ